MEVASFDVLPMQDFYDKYLPTPSWDGPLNDRFDALGFQSLFFLNNMGSMVVGLLMIPIQGFLLILLKPLTRFSRRITTIKNKIHASLFWSQQIILLNESFSIICMCALINVLHLSFDSKVELINSTLTIAFLVLCTAMTIIVCAFLLVKLPDLKEKTMKIKYGEMT